MKKLASILCFMILSMLLSGCKRFSVIENSDKHIALSSRFLQIDSLIQYNPDSALFCLTSLQSESLSEVAKNYYEVLLSEALYKTYNPQINRKSLIDAMHYYDSLQNCYSKREDVALLSARSHYMNAVGLQENDSIIDACREYFRTKEIFENNFNTNKITDYEERFLALTYSRIAEVFYTYGMGHASLYALKNALSYFEKVENYDLSKTYNLIGNSYYLENIKDSALYYYRMAIKTSEARNNTFVHNMSKSEAALLYYEMGNCDTALMFIRESLLAADDEDMYLARCHTMGLLFSYECQYDSAIFYLKKSINRNYYPTQVVAAEHLMKCYEAIGDNVMTERYKKIYSAHFSKYREGSEIVTELTNVYESYKLKNSLQEQDENRRKQSCYVVVISILILIFIIMIIIYRKIVADRNKVYDDDIRAKDKALLEMRRKIESNSFVKEPICQLILDNVQTNRFKSKVPYESYKEFALDKNQIIELRDAVNRHYNNFLQKLSKQYSDLKPDDMDYCCLYLLGLKDADVSALMQRAYSTVCERSRKLKHIFNSKEPLPISLKNIIDSYNLN